MVAQARYHAPASRRPWQPRLKSSSTPRVPATSLGSGSVRSATMPSPLRTCGVTAIICEQRYQMLDRARLLRLYTAQRAEETCANFCWDNQ